MSCLEGGGEGFRGDVEVAAELEEPVAQEEREEEGVRVLTAAEGVQTPHFHVRPGFDIEVHTAENAGRTAGEVLPKRAVLGERILVRDHADAGAVSLVPRFVVGSIPGPARGEAGRDVVEEGLAALSDVAIWADAAGCKGARLHCGGCGGHLSACVGGVVEDEWRWIRIRHEDGRRNC